MGRVINLLNSPIIGKKSSFSFVSLLTGLGMTILFAILSDKIGREKVMKFAFVTFIVVIPSPVSNETNEKELFLPIIGELSKFITRPICFPNNEYWYKLSSFFNDIALFIIVRKAYRKAESTA